MLVEQKQLRYKRPLYLMKERLDLLVQLIGFLVADGVHLGPVHVNPLLLAMLHVDRCDDAVALARRLFAQGVKLDDNTLSTLVAGLGRWGYHEQAAEVRRAASVSDALIVASSCSTTRSNSWASPTRRSLT